MFNKSDKKKKHPYRTLAVFTLATAGMIGAVNKMKCVVKEKVSAMTAFIKKTTEE